MRSTGQETVIDVEGHAFKCSRVCKSLDMRSNTRLERCPSFLPHQADVPDNLRMGSLP